MVLPDSHEVSRASRYSGTGCALFGFGYEAFTRSGGPFQTLPLPTPGSRMPALQPRMDVSTRFGLFPVRSPLLRESRLIFFPSGTEMFHFPEFAPCNLCVRLPVTGYDSRRVSPFRDPRLTGCLAPPRGLSQLTTSFFAFRRQGIHPMLLSTCFSKSFLPSLFNCKGAASCEAARPCLGRNENAYSLFSQTRSAHLVELDGIEPTASCVQSRRSPN